MAAPPAAPWFQGLLTGLFNPLGAWTLTFNDKGGQPFSASAASKLGSDWRSLAAAAEWLTSKVQHSWSSGPARTVLRSGSGNKGATSAKRALDSFMRCSNNISGSLRASAADNVGTAPGSVGRGSGALAITGV